MHGGPRTHATRLHAGQRSLWRFRCRYGALQPYVHYIPVANSMEDLLTQVRWVHAHDDQVRRIAEAGHAFAQKYLQVSRGVRFVEGCDVCVNSRALP